MVVTEDWYFCSHRLTLAKDAVEAGFDVAVATRVQAHANIIRHIGIVLIPLKHMKRKGKNPWHELKSIWELFRIYQKYQPDIVHHVAMKPMLYGSVASWFAGVKYKVQAISGFGFVFSSSHLRAKLLRLPIRLMLRLALSGANTHVIAQNSDDTKMAKYLGVTPQSIYLIEGSGVDTDAYSMMSEPKSDVVKFTLVARMLWDKGVDEFVGAARILRVQGFQFQAVLVGEPDDSNPASIPLKQLKKWAKEGVVDWQGRREDIVNVWKDSHVAVLPSYREGLPKSLLEAASCGRAMIATDVPGCRSIVKHESTGLLVKARDVDALAQAMQRLIEDRGLRKSMGLAARKEVEERFSDTIINKQIISLYQTLSAP